MNAMNTITLASRRAEDRRNAERRLVERRMSADRRQATPATSATVTPIRHQHRDRDFGVGYGNSSGYASHSRYASAWAQPHFRIA